MDKVSQKEAFKEKIQVTLNFENEENEIVTYFEDYFKEKQVAAKCNFEIKSNSNEFDKKQNNSSRPMVHFIAKKIQDDTKTFCNILSDLSEAKRISHLTMDISFNDASQLKNPKKQSILQEIGKKISMKPLTLLDLRLQSCQIDDTSFSDLIKNLDLTKISYLKFFLVDNQMMSDRALEKFQESISKTKEKKEKIQLRYIEMIFCEKAKITEDGMNKLWKGFQRCYLQKGSITRGKKEQNFQQGLNVQKKSQEEQKIDNSQISTYDKSQGASSILADKMQERSKLGKDKAVMIESSFLSFTQETGLNSPVADNEYPNLPNQNEESD